mmetsp:Transcript_2720/g.4222  ORF Transcript_2720/g.4222 Transcript_2720/m.4222 type:complete len:101 (-) Transcript_2720:819-1121(-)
MKTRPSCFQYDQQFTTEFAYYTVMQLKKCYLTKVGGSRAPAQWASQDWHAVIVPITCATASYVPSRGFFRLVVFGNQLIVYEMSFVLNRNLHGMRRGFFG